MEKLERFLENVERIANSLELLVKRTEPITVKFGGAEKSNVQEIVSQIAAMPAGPVANVPQMPVAPVQPQPQTPVQAPVAIPVAQQVEGFTQEQIARAMANAAQAGRQDIIQNIFATFKVQTLMEINPANYNQIATMLREAGIQI